MVRLLTMKKDIRVGVLFLCGFGLPKPHKKSSRFLSCSFVGVARLERATACTPCKNASQLHHTPIALICVAYLSICGCKDRNFF